MNKTDKEYTVNRIKSIVSSNLISCECKEPDLYSHICKAAVDGQLKVKPAQKLKEMARDKVLASTRRYSDGPEIKLTKIFQEPDSYKKEMVTFKAEEKAKQKANASAEIERDKLIDRVWLGEFQDGTEAIALANKILPSH